MTFLCGIPLQANVPQQQLTPDRSGPGHTHGWPAPWALRCDRCDRDFAYTSGAIGQVGADRHVCISCKLGHRPGGERGLLPVDVVQQHVVALIEHARSELEASSGYTLSGQAARDAAAGYVPPGRRSLPEVQQHVAEALTAAAAAAADPVPVDVVPRQLDLDGNEIPWQQVHGASAEAAPEGTETPAAGPGARCQWCGGSIPARTASGRQTRRDVVTCSKPCRQARSRAGLAR